MKKPKIIEAVEDIRHITSWEDIKKIFGNKIQNYPGINKQFKKGFYGRLWKLKGTNLTLKITTNREEMETANLIKGKDTKGFLKIYEIVEVDSHKYNERTIPKLQLRIQELCYPIKDLQKASRYREFGVCTDIIRGNFEELKSLDTSNLVGIFDFYDTLEVLREESPYIESLLNNENLKKDLAPILFKFIELLRRVNQDLPGIDVAEDLDIHADNIMEDQKKIWKLVDF